MNSTLRRQIQSVSLAVLMLIQMFLIPATIQAQDRVVVTVGQPNIWSLEQAHYLLARIRERNLGISNPALGETDLDPNAVNATTIDAMRTLFEVAASYDQGLGLTNRLNRENLESNQTRRQELFARRANLFDEKSRLLAESGRLNSELRTLEENEANADAIKLKKREILAVTEQASAVDKQLENVNAEIALVGTGSTSLTSPSPPGGSGTLSGGMGDRLSKAITDNFTKDVAKNPRLAATVKLDNYIQMQYELLAKQLTLLRDEVGPNERLIFLELPTSIYATPGRGNERTVQSWWKVDGYYRNNRFAGEIARLNQLKESLYDQHQREVATKGPAEILALVRNYDTQVREINEDIANARQEFYDDRSDAVVRGGAVFLNPEDRGEGIRLNEGAALLGLGDFIDARSLAADLAAPATVISTYINGQLSGPTLALLPGCIDKSCLNALTHDLNRILLGPNLSTVPAFAGLQMSTDTKLLLMSNPVGDQLVRLNRYILEDAFPNEIFRSRSNEARVIDLIPRQSSLNVNDLKEVVQERGFKALFSLLIGIGGSVNYQQRRERFEQFQQQEVYAAGFGKGESTFGWTFSPMPGTRRLAPGTRTTYAVMVVPRDASRIRLKAQGLSFQSKHDQSTPDFANPETKTMELDIPNGPGEGFFVTRIDYPHVDVDQRSVVVLRGTFSSQTGILVNGTPLLKTVGVANPWLGSEKERSDPHRDLGEPDKGVKGYYEVINSSQIIMTFLMPKGFTGTPQITVISPSRARTLNDIRLTFNGSPNSRLADEYPIGDKPSTPDPLLKIREIQISPPRIIVGKQITAEADANLILDGVKKTDPTPKIFFNATECTSAAVDCKLTLLGGDRLHRLTLKLPLGLERVSFTVVQKDRVTTSQIDNPIFARAVETGRVYDVGDEEDVSDDSVTIRIEGKRIEDLTAGSDDAQVEWKGQLFNQGVLVVTELAKPTLKVSLIDDRTKAEVSTFFIKRRLPKKKPEPSPRRENNNQ